MALQSFFHLGVEVFPHSVSRSTCVRKPYTYYPAGPLTMFYAITPTRDVSLLEFCAYGVCYWGLLPGEWWRSCVHNSLTFTESSAEELQTHAPSFFKAGEACSHSAVLQHFPWSNAAEINCNYNMLCILPSYKCSRCTSFYVCLAEPMPSGHLHIIVENGSDGATCQRQHIVIRLTFSYTQVCCCCH